MWIRSQDKTQIVPMCELYISTRQKGYCICTNRGNDLGIYPTKEKAIKVLNMIHEQIFEYDKAMFLGAENAYYVSCKIEMPQDDEVE